MVSNRLGDKKGTNLSNVIRFNEAIKTTNTNLFFQLALKLLLATIGITTF
jgi:hypothetical protein